MHLQLRKHRTVTYPAKDAIAFLFKEKPEHPPVMGGKLLRLRDRGAFTTIRMPLSAVNDSKIRTLASIVCAVPICIWYRKVW